MATIVTITVPPGGALPTIVVQVAPQNNAVGLTAQEARKQELKTSAHKVLKTARPVFKTGINVAAHIGAAALITTSGGTIVPIIAAATICGTLTEVSELVTQGACCLAEASVDSSIDCCVDNDCC